MVMDPSSLLRVLRRAIKIAATPPMGPVYVCLPMDVLDAPVVEEVRPTSVPSTRVMPDEATIQEAAAILATAENPVFIVGDGVAYAGAQEELTRLAELVGAEVWEADAGEVNMSYTHSLYQGMTGHMFGYSSLPITSKGDVNLICGTYVVPEVFPELGNIFAAHSKVIHVDLNAYEIAKNHPVDIGMVSDPKLTLALLAKCLTSTMTAEQKTAAQHRTTRIAAAKAERDTQAKSEDHSRGDQMPLHMTRFMEELIHHLPEDTIIFDEALTNSPPLARYFRPTRTGQYFLTRGGSLGVGFPGAIGVKLAHPGSTVLGFSGDGGSMYTFQALWTAARHNLDVKFIVCNNGSYRLLQANISAYWKERDIPAHDFPLSFDLSRPLLQFVDLAHGMGVQGVRVEKPSEIAAAIQQAFRHPGPFLIDLVLEGSTHPGLIGVRCGQ
jgi:benzoylformate decarboxylase